MQVTHTTVNTQKTTLLHSIKVSECTLFLLHRNGGQTYLNVLIDDPNIARQFYRELWWYQRLRFHMRHTGGNSRPPRSTLFPYTTHFRSSNGTLVPIVPLISIGPSQIGHKNKGEMFNLADKTDSQVSNINTNLI